MGFYDDMADVASEVLAEFKQGTVTLRRTVTADPDPSTPWIPGSATVTDYTLEATVSGVAQEFVNGTTILATDEQVICAVPSVTPNMSTDALLIDGATVTVIQVTPIPAAGTPVAYRFVIRR